MDASVPRWGSPVTRSQALPLIAVALVGYGVYRALFVPALLIGPPVLLLLFAFVLQAVSGIAAGIGVWRGAPWAPLAVVVLGATIAATALIEAFVLGIIPYLRAMLEAVVAVTVAILVATYVNAAPARTSRPRERVV